MQNVCYVLCSQSVSVKHLTHMTNQLFPLSAKKKVPVLFFVFCGQHATWPVLADMQKLDHSKVIPEDLSLFFFLVSLPLTSIYFGSHVAYTTSQHFYTSIKIAIFKTLRRLGTT